MDEKQQETVVVVAGAVGVICLSLALLVGAINLGSELAAWWVVFVFQFLITTLGAIAAVIVTLWILSFPFNALTTKVYALQRAHGELLAKLQKRTPTFVAISIVVAEATMLIADKSFQGETLPTVTVSLVMLVLFWIGNELMVSDSRPKFFVGLAVWGLAVASLPVAATLHRKGLDKLFEDLGNLDMATKMTIGLVLLCLLLLPFVFQRGQNG